MGFPSDDELLSFDKSRLANWDEARVEAALRDHPEVFRSHLLIAMWIERWVQDLEEPHFADIDNSDFIAALREVMAHLRQADFVPGGTLYGDITAGF